MLQPTLPDYDFSLVIRTDFTDDSAWEHICRLLKEPQTTYGFQSSVECLSDRSCAGLQPEDVRSVLPFDSQRPFVFLVDAEAMFQPDHAVLVVDLSEEAGRTFRVIPSEAWGVENNLRLANMDFADFADAVDDGGVFRGFPGGPL
jgi:hypothetical protein